MEKKMKDLNFVCVECGATALETFRRFQGNVIKIAQCEQCGSVVDKYIEFDTTIILLDALLHKRQAYRHMLCNTALQWHWKLLMVLLFCDAYRRWQYAHSQRHLEDGQDISILYAALEWDFYTMFLYAAIDWMVLCGTVFTAVALVKRPKLLNDKAMETKCGKSTLLTVFKSMTVSSFGKLLVIPATIWGQHHSALCLWLTQLFVFTSNATALQVVFSLGQATAVVLLGAAHLAQLGVQHALETT